MGRAIVRIRGKANEALLELSQKFKVDPSLLVEKLLIQNRGAMQDDALCRKNFFLSSIMYRLELPFSFPYECEEFEFELERSKLRLYLERIPKRYVIDRLPFRTLATIIIELAQQDAEFAKNGDPNVVADKLHSRYSVLAFNVLKRVIIVYRRVTGDYYNIGVIEPPMNIEEFQKKVKMSVILGEETRSSSEFMPIKEDSYIVVAQRLEEDLRSKIVRSVISEFEGKKLDFLSNSNEYFDAAKVFYYHEQWNLCLIQSVIAMESALAGLVFNSDATKFYLSRKTKNLDSLRKMYKEAQGLPQKIMKFLFPLIKELNLSEAQSELRRIMPLINHKKREDGIYDLRSKVIHEGISITKNQAEQSVEIVPQFLRILNIINSNVA